MINSFYSHGKLLLSAEYVVLDGALALALPTKFGQSMSLSSVARSGLSWKSFDHAEQVWFEVHFNIEEHSIRSTSDNPISKRLIEILSVTERLKPGFLNSISGHEVQTHLEFPNNWGLGSSSTLINNISNWAGVNAFELLEATFGGSGYDLACTDANGPITYQITSKPNKATPGIERKIEQAAFEPSFKDHLYFIHLNQKQDSRKGIALYQKYRNNLTSVIEEVNEITKAMIECHQLADFEQLMVDHESIISGVIQQPPVQQRLFPDFPGTVKSLGAWGGDFILVASSESPKPYFETKGFHTLFSYKDMVL